MDMRFHWLRDKVKLKEIKIYWKPGETNLGDYLTKHHPTSHHRKVRKLYLINQLVRITSQLQGCVNNIALNTHIRAQYA